MADEVVIEILKGEDTEHAHILGCFRTDDTLFHLQLESNRNLEDIVNEDGSYWTNLSGKHLANFMALHCRGCWPNKSKDESISLRYAVQGGRFLGWR